jgi:hypothetical protein
MLTATRDYLARHETGYVRHMAEMPGGESAPHWERRWSGLEAASLGLLALREVLVGAVEPLNVFASSREQLHLSADSPIRNYDLQVRER